MLENTEELLECVDRIVHTGQFGAYDTNCCDLKVKI